MARDYEGEVVEMRCRSCGRVVERERRRHLGGAEVAQGCEECGGVLVPTAGWADRSE